MACSAAHRHDGFHEVIQGSETKPTAAYCDGFCDAILRALCQIIGLKQFGANVCLCKTEMAPPDDISNEICASEVNMDIAAWKPVLDRAADLLAQKTTNAVYPGLETAAIGTLIR